MNRQKNTTLIPSIVITVIAMFIIFFNMYLSANQQKLLPQLPSEGDFNLFTSINMILTSVFICFSACVLAISLRFQQKMLVSLCFLIQGCLFFGIVNYASINYYNGAPTNTLVQLLILAVASFVLYFFYDIERWIRIISIVAYSAIFIASIAIAIFEKNLSTSALISWDLIVDTFQALAFICLIVIIAFKLKAKEDYAQPILIAFIILASYNVPNFILSSFVPTYLSFYQVSFSLSYIVIGFCILNAIISDYDAVNRAIALDQELDKQFIQRRNYYNNFASQLDGLQHSTDTVYSPILAVECLLLEYAKQAKINKIDFSANLDIPTDIRVKHGDLCLSLANILDNAMEACDAMTSGRKFIQIEASKVDHMLMLEIKNSYNALPLIPSGNLFLTSKEFLSKGMGLTTTKDIATRYNGSLSIQTAVDVPEPNFVTQVYLAHVL